MASRLLGPIDGHAHQGVSSPETYRAACRRYRGERTHEARPDEWAALGAPHVSHGQWFVDCGCGNGCSLSVDWRLACCFLCGAIYNGVSLPEESEAIERVLAARSDAKHRNYRAPETVDDLITENEIHGVPV